LFIGPHEELAGVRRIDHVDDWRHRARQSFPQVVVVEFVGQRRHISPQVLDSVDHTTRGEDGQRVRQSHSSNEGIRLGRGESNDSIAACDRLLGPAVHHVAEIDRR
jgi:hypothetical protein